MRSILFRIWHWLLASSASLHCLRSEAGRAIEVAKLQDANYLGASGLPSVA